MTNMIKSLLKPNPQPKSIVVKGSGDISGQLAEFRAILGEPVNGTPNQTTGRREVNWDGVPANLTNNNNFPFDFFNVTDPAGPNGRKRGLVMNNATYIPCRYNWLFRDGCFLRSRIQSI